MSSTATSSQAAGGTPTAQGVAMRLEVVGLPVSDVDRAKAFYASLGWREDADFRLRPGYRIVQMTPPQSRASINFGEGINEAAPGSIDTLVLAVEDVDAARAELASHGVEVSEVFHGPGAGFRRRSDDPRAPGRDPEGGSYVSWAFFSDPDGNGWLLQEIKTRLPGREWSEEG
jgi:catechol 2,3-dioxygenase-like lactoylglutathione lyase family enzyme